MSSVEHALAVFSDYDEMRSLMMAGLFVVPDCSDINIWHGLIHVREGRFRYGTFRFILVGLSWRMRDEGLLLEARLIRLGTQRAPGAEPLSSSCQRQRSSTYRALNSAILRPSPSVCTLRTPRTARGRSWSSSTGRTTRSSTR